MLSQVVINQGNLALQNRAENVVQTVVHCFSITSSNKLIINKIIPLSQSPLGSPRKKESYIKITLFFYIRIKLVKPRMDFPGQFPKIFLTHQSFSLESLKHLCPHALTTNITS